MNGLFESAKKRRERSGRVVGSYDSGAPSKKNAEIELQFRFEQGLIGNPFRARFDREERLEDGYHDGAS
jgi:hypothetical protein